MNELTSTILAWAQPIVLAFLAWFLYRRKNNADTVKTVSDITTVDISNFNDGLKYWKDIAESFKAQIDTILPEINKLREDNLSLQSQLTELKLKLDDSMNEKITLKGQIANLDKLVKALQQENTKLNRMLHNLKNHKNEPE